MKKYNYIAIAIMAIGAFLMGGCKESDDLRPDGGSWNSGSIEGFQITPINGGAEIQYTIPNDPDILYIMAEYERNGKTYTEKASVHNNLLIIEGFHRVSRVKATLYKVNRKEQRSAPLEIEFEPLESVIDIGLHTLEMEPNFGGVSVSWENPRETELGIRFMKVDVATPDKMDFENMYFSSLKEERRTYRGFEQKEATFAVSFEDKWGNVSDTTYYTTTPLFEIMIPKPYADYRTSIPYDNVSNYSGRNTGLLWDNIVNTASHGWLTLGGNSGLSMTIDLKQVVKLSRIVIHGYHINAVYGQANITQFEAWGTDQIPTDRYADKSYWLDEWSVRQGRIFDVESTTTLPVHTFKDDWQYLGWHSIPRYPSATSPSNSDPAALDLAANGTEYIMPDAKPVRYVRIFVREAQLVMPPANNYWSMGEITFYGNNTGTP